LSKSIENIFHVVKRIKAKIYSFFLLPCFFSTGKKCSIIPPLRFFGLSEISLGSCVTIHTNCWVQVLKSDENINLPVIRINDHVGIGMNSTISAVKSIIIEEYVFTASNVYISDHAHKYDDINIPTSNQSVCNVADVRIGAHTWLGRNSVVLPGVTIGRHCVIGANSVVNTDIPDYSLAVGAPAKVVKRYNSKNQSWVRV
jgi:acetyltransferase-like isoleucine patch superfamily enzyme